eukprot:GEMP01117737.1.p1 GENE.GEMP01117737.1~~GEMP01117737.1.p1  ORF type:complete len:175 (-),score=14.31 GEMP01117737.1:49-573(-)
MEKQKSTQVSLSALAFVFAEMVNYCRRKAQTSHNLEYWLHHVGSSIGFRILDTYQLRDRSRRENRILSILTFVANFVWKQLFGHTCELLKGQNHEDEYMLNDKNMILNRFISPTADSGHVNCAAFAAGIIEGLLRSAEFPADVTAHFVDDANRLSTTMLVKFHQSVMDRERLLS